MRVLLVDDDTGLCRTMEQVLAGYGIEVVSAADLGAARDLLDAAPVDAVLLDIQLAHERGTDLLATARARGVPCVMLTNSDRQEDVLEAFQGAAAGYILKEDGAVAVVEAIRDAQAGRMKASSAVVPHLVAPLRHRVVLWVTLERAVVRVDDVERVRITAAHQVALLYTLAQASGGWVEDAVLAARIWGRAHHEHGRNNLNVLIHRIRRAAREAGIDQPVVEKRRGTTRLAIEAVTG